MIHYSYSVTTWIDHCSKLLYLIMVFHRYEVDGPPVVGLERLNRACDLNFAYSATYNLAKT